MVGKGTSGGECYGWHSSTNKTGRGLGYLNSCIHSGSNDYTGGNTVWYNYAVASAGTITDDTSIGDTTYATNQNITTESICPKGWTLPGVAQIINITGPYVASGGGSSTYVSSFNPVYGGYYANGNLYSESQYGYLWSSDAASKVERWILSYTSDVLRTTLNGRPNGFYIRCVSEEKDVSDLTYMQDMTPSVAANTA